MEGREVPKVALILAGGKGTRLRPITYNIPKPLVKVNNKAIIAHILDELARNGIETAYVSVGYKADKIISYLNKYKNNIKIRYVKENPDRPRGTGGAVRLALKEIMKHYDGDVFITNGDELCRIDIAKMYNLHLRERAAITLAVKRVKPKEVKNFGVVALDGNRIMGFVEKPRPEEAPSNYISMGKYIANTGLYNKLPRKKAFSFEKDFLQKSAIKKYAHISNGPWYPTDDMERLSRARKEWKRLEERLGQNNE